MNATLKAEEQIMQKPSNGMPVRPAKIMVATDFSCASQPAVEYAASLARRFCSRLYLTHVIRYVVGHAMMEPGMQAPTVEELRVLSEREAKAIMNSGRLDGVTSEILIEQGPLWPTLEGLIEKHGINLLVVGTHGVSDVMKAVFGSDAEEIFRHARIPVMTVGPAVPPEALRETEWKTIVFATGCGPGAEREAELAFRLAQENKARVLMLHVTGRPDGGSEFDANLEKEGITQRLQELVPAGCGGTCRVEYHVAYGNPMQEILRYAREQAADLIVMGAKKQGALAGHTPHSTAFAVVREACCPVLTIKS